jgi:hypothetical protein
MILLKRLAGDKHHPARIAVLAVIRERSEVDLKLFAYAPSLLALWILNLALAQMRLEELTSNACEVESMQEDLICATVVVTRQFAALEEPSVMPICQAQLARCLTARR